MLRAFLLASFMGGLAVAGAAQPPAAPARPKLASELPKPKAGEKLKLERSEVKTRKDEDDLLEVTDVTAAKAKDVAMPAAEWTLDADGWFDNEGFNISKAYPRSGLWAMRTIRGNRPPSSTGSGLPTSPSALVPHAPPRLYRAGPNDIITHIDGVAVTSYARFVYAINTASNPRDIPIVVMNGNTGRRHVFYVTAYKTGNE
ncbi:MAG: hypothetical protein U0791_26995 [Gemmataceae bacterium]